MIRINLIEVFRFFGTAIAPMSIFLDLYYLIFANLGIIWLIKILMIPEMIKNYNRKLTTAHYGRTVGFTQRINSRNKNINLIGLIIGSWNSFNF